MKAAFKVAFLVKEKRMSRVLYDKISQYNLRSGARFCMPAHCGEEGIDGIYSSAKYDWTEVEGLDNLLFSDGVILQCENSLAHNYGYKYALALTNGSTGGMQIAMLYAREIGGAVIAIGDMHKSFYSSARIFGVRIYCFSTLQEAVESEIVEDVYCVFVTSPDYFGRLTDLAEIKKFAVERGAKLIVDEAHSAHFPYSTLLPDNASKYADIAFASMHKTLPVYGGGAVLFANDTKSYEICRRFRSEIHSTSPSYLVMASMDYAQDLMREKGEELYLKVKQAVDNFKNGNTVGKVLETDDFSRVVIKIDGVDCDSVSLQLANKGIFAEMSCGDLLVLIVTPFNCDKLELLKNALQDITLERLKDDLNFRLNLQRSKKKGYTVFVDVDEAEGEISAMDIGIYPPGVPSIRKGDLLDKNAINFIKKYSTKLFGLASGKVGVLK